MSTNKPKEKDQVDNSSSNEAEGTKSTAKSLADHLAVFVYEMVLKGKQPSEPSLWLLQAPGKSCTILEDVISRGKLPRGFTNWDIQVPSGKTADALYLEFISSTGDYLDVKDTLEPPSEFEKLVRKVNELQSTVNRLQTQVAILQAQQVSTYPKDPFKPNRDWPTPQWPQPYFIGTPAYSNGTGFNPSYAKPASHVFRDMDMNHTPRYAVLTEDNIPDVIGQLFTGQHSTQTTNNHRDVQDNSSGALFDSPVTRVVIAKSFGDLDLKL